MTKDTYSNEESALQAMFARQVPPVADDGFSKQVGGQIRRAIWRRRLILSTAALIGLLFALPAATDLLLALIDSLVTLIATAKDSGASGSFHLLLEVFSVDEVARLAGEALRNVRARIDPLVWYQQNQWLILAGFLAGISLLTTRLVND